MLRIKKLRYLQAHDRIASNILTLSQNTCFGLLSSNARVIKLLTEILVFRFFERHTYFFTIYTKKAARHTAAVSSVA